MPSHQGKGGKNREKRKRNESGKLDYRYGPGHYYSEYTGDVDGLGVGFFFWGGPHMTAAVCQVMMGEVGLEKNK